MDEQIVRAAIVTDLSWMLLLKSPTENILKVIEFVRIERNYRFKYCEILRIVHHVIETLHNN